MLTKGKCMFLQSSTRHLEIRIQLLIVLFSSIGTLLCSTLESQLLLFSISVCYMLYMRHYKALCVLLCIGLAISLCATLFSGILALFIPQFPKVTLANVAVPCMRMLVVCNVVYPLACVGKTHSMIATLQRLRLPFCLYLPVVVMIRFIPTFLTDLKQIIEAIRLRGYPFSVMFCLIHPVLTLRLVGVPMIMRTLLSADYLSVAAMLKGVEYSKTVVTEQSEKWQIKEFILIGTMFCVSILLVVSEHYGTVVSNGMQ